MTAHYDTVVVGAGQAGLATEYHLARQGQRFIILDATHRAGGSWLNRWDSVRLFTPSTHDGLPGMPFPGDYRFPSGAEMPATSRPTPSGSPSQSGPVSTWTGCSAKASTTS